MQYLIIIPIALIAIAIIIFAIYKKYVALQTEKKILKYGRESEHYIFKLVHTAFNPKNTFRNVYLPKSAYDTDNVTEVDIIIVTKAGVFVVEVKGNKGLIDNPSSGDWCQYYNEKVLPFHNPFEQNSSHIRAISDILKREGVYNIPMKSIVVYATNDVKFKYHYDNLLTPEKLLPYLKSAASIRSISNHEIHKVVKAITKHAVRGFGVKRNHRLKIKKDAKKLKK